MRKWLESSLAIFIIVSLLLTACGGEDATDTPKPPAATAVPEAPKATTAVEKPTSAPITGALKVGLVTDVGRINDRSFNQSAWEGVLLAEEMGAEVKYVETKDAKDYEDNIRQFTDEGFDVVVTVGFALGDATIKMAQEYPDIKFIGVDQFQGEALPNLVGLIFHEDHSGYLAGALAARLNKSGTIAGVFGTDLVPPVVAFKEGYEAGAKSINPDIKIISTYHPGEIGQAFTDPEWGAATAAQAIDQGADVIFAAGGMTGNGALEETATQEGLFCIGVDSDQWETVPGAHPCLVSSAMKLITPGVSELIKAVQAGTFEGGNTFGGAGLAGFHDFEDQIPQDVKDELAKIDMGLKDGSISTGYGVGAPEVEEMTLKVGLVTDVGRINDRSFNQSAWEGVLLAEEMGAEVKYVETKDAKDYEDNIRQFTDEGYDVVVTVGFALGDATIKMAQEYPDIKFIGVDQFQGEALPNLVGLIFHEDHSGYLAGALAARLNKSGTIAGVFGTDLVPPVVAFKEGYEAGAKSINPDIKIISTYHPGEIGQAFTDPEWGAATAAQAIDQGADVIFAAGGMTGNGALEETATQEGLFCIGVDSDQWETVPGAHPCLVSSAMKLITPGVSELIKAVQAGTFEGGNTFGGAGLAGFHDFEDQIPQDVKDELAKIDMGLKDGSISTGYGVGAPEVEEMTLKVGLVTDVGRINDRSFNQSAWEGVLLAEEMGAEVKYVETKDAKDYEDNIRQFTDEGYDVVVTVGFALGDATIKMAQEYPDIKFIGVDQFQGEALPNLVGLIFHEDHSGYLAGALAARLNKSGTIAGVFGTDLVPPVVAFKEGYEAGAKSINPDIKIISTYHPGEIGQAFTDPEWGAATAAQAIDQGADVIFAAGGMTGNGALEETATQEGLFCIGVDSDQWETVPGAHPCLVSSAMKLITPGVSELIKAVQAGTFEGGNTFGGAGLAGFHDFEDQIPQDVKDELAKIDMGLKDGSISTGYGQ